MTMAIWSPGVRIQIIEKPVGGCRVTITAKHSVFADRTVNLKPILPLSVASG